MSRDFFAFLKDQPKQDYYAALGSGQRVKVKKDFRRKAGKAYDLCLKAIEAETQDYRNDRWRKVFGSNFPPRPVATTAADSAFESALKSGGYEARNTERFIEDMYPIDIRFDIELECEVKQDGFRPSLLRSLLAASRVLQAKKDLKFFVTDTDVPPPFTLLWKVLNRGPTAVRRDCIRGEIVPDDGRLEKIERTNFRGDHIVECYAVKDGVVVAKDRIHVPITE